MNRFPLQLSRRQWSEIEEHYEESEPDWTEADPSCIEPPPPDDHDDRFMDFYDTREGDIGDDSEPPF